MAKIYHKQPAQSEEDNLDCMCSFISMFYFSQGRFAQKLLPNRKHGSRRRAGIGYPRHQIDILHNAERNLEDVIGVNGNQDGSVGFGKASIKTLMQEEMSKAHSSKKLVSCEIERIKPDLGFGGNLENNHKQTGKNYVIASDRHANDLRNSVEKSCQSNRANKSDLDLAELMVEINHQNQEKQMDFGNNTDSFANLNIAGNRKDDHNVDPDGQLTQKYKILQKAEGDVNDAFLTQKSIVAKKFTGNGDLYHSKEFMDALESLNLNKELFLKLLHDPDLLLSKHIQKLKLLNSQAGEFSEFESCRNLEEKELLVEDIGTSGQCEELDSRKLFHIPNAFFWKDKSKRQKSSSGSRNDDPPTSSRIVVLKPNPVRNQKPSVTISSGSSPRSDYCLRHKEGTESVASHFSFKEIKRKLIHAIGESRKERLLIIMDGILHRIPHGSQDSGDMGKRSARESVGTGLPRETPYTTEHNDCPAMKRKRKIKPKECQPNMEYGIDSAMVGSNAAVAHPLYGESFYKEAKHHLVEMLNTQGRKENLPTGQAAETLGSLLALPECNFLSPRFNHGSDKDPRSTQKMRSSLMMQLKQETYTDCLSPLKCDIESSTSIDSNQDDEPQLLFSNPAPFDTHIQLAKDLILNECMETKEITDTVYMEERDRPVVYSENNSNQPSFTSERCNEEGPASLSGLGPWEERPLPVTSSLCISPSSGFIQKSEVPKVLMEIPDRPSPVSVLEPSSLEDTNSPGNKTVEHADFSLQPPQIDFKEQEHYTVLASSDSETNQSTCTEDKEAKFEYIRNILEASGLSYDELSKRLGLSDLLLDEFVFDEVDISSNLSNLLPDDPKLLFDCTNEVLVEIWERHFSCTPWLSIIKPNVQRIPVGLNLIQEVCKDIDRNLCAQFPCPFDQTIRKDLDCGKWMKLGSETESTVFQMADAILEDLMEENVLKLWV